MWRPIWERSLYWTSVVGFSVCIAATLAVQAIALQIWLANAPTLERLSRFTHEVALDVSHALENDPQLDIQHYVDVRYPNPFATIYIVMVDQRVILRGPLRPTRSSIESSRAYFRNVSRPVALPESWVKGPSQSAPIIVHGEVVGGVAGMVPRNWHELVSWKLAILSGVLLLLATTLTGRFVVGTLHHRVGELEQAARRYGAGDFSARAPEAGVDELAGLATVFNRMAVDLGTREAQLKEADRARRLLLADISHELMTPLTAIRAYQEVLLASPLARDSDSAHWLTVIGDETLRLEHLVGDLLDLARLEAGGESINVDEVSVENLFGRVATRHAPEAEAKGVLLSTAIEEGAEIIFGDPLRLERALQNLAANALRHTPPGGDIDIRAELHGEHVLLSVRDTGCGIPAAHLPFVFDRFYKVDPARVAGAAAGSGLGLSIVRAIVERHGGTVSVVSEPGVSTVFTIQLPINHLPWSATSRPLLLAANSVAGQGE